MVYPLCDLRQATFCSLSLCFLVCSSGLLLVLPLKEFSELTQVTVPAQPSALPRVGAQ